MPVCIYCHKEKDIDQFYKHKHRKNSFLFCKQCGNERRAVAAKSRRKKAKKIIREKELYENIDYSFFSKYWTNSWSSK